MVTPTRYAWGAVALLLVLAGLAAAALALRRRCFPDWSGAPARLAEITLWLALLIAESELLGAIGLFRLGFLVALSLLLGTVTHAAIGRGRDARPRAARAGVPSPAGRPRAARAHGLSAAERLVLVAVAGLLTAEWAGPTLDAYDHGIRTFDSLWYHLPWAASFAQTAHILPLRFTDVEYLTAFYPATSELLHAVGIVLLGRDTLSPWANLVWLWLVLLAAYCVGRRRGVGTVSLCGAALAMATPMVRFSQAGSAANDVVGIFFVLAALAFVLEGDRRRTADDVLAAIACGLAIAVKLSMLAPALAIAVGAVAVAPSLARAARWVGVLVVSGGFWYARDLVASGNPLPWIHIPGFSNPAAPLQAQTGFSVAHYATSAHFWSAFAVPGLHAGLGPWWPVVLVAAIAGPLLCLLPGAGARVRLAGAVALVSLLAYLVTPESAAGPAGDPVGFAFNLRYSAPALALCLTVASLALPVRRARYAVPVAVAVLLALLVATVAQPSLWPSNHLGGAIAIGVIVALAATVMPATVAALRRRRRPAISLPRVAATAACALIALAAAAGGGYAAERHYLAGRYIFGPGVSSLSGVWRLFRGIHDTRVGVVGTFGGFFSYPLDGLDVSDRVVYIAHRGPHGSFTPITTCRAFRAAVAAAGLHYLVTTPGRDPWHPQTLTASPETGWIAGDPSARVIYRRIAFGEPISVFALTGPLRPGDCRQSR